MTEDAGAIARDRKMLLDMSRQLFGDVRIHTIAIRPGRLRRIDVEAGAYAEVVRVGLARKAQATRARIGHDDRNTKLGGYALRARLDDEVLFGARKAGKPVEHRYTGRLRLFRDEHAKAHRAARRFGGVRVHALDAAEATVLRYGVDIVRHFGSDAMRDRAGRVGARLSMPCRMQRQALN